MIHNKQLSLGLSPVVIFVCFWINCGVTFWNTPSAAGGERSWGRHFDLLELLFPKFGCALFLKPVRKPENPRMSRVTNTDVTVLPILLRTAHGIDFACFALRAWRAESHRLVLRISDTGCKLSANFGRADWSQYENV